MILIVDDTPENLYSLKKILELNGFEADTAAGGEEALRKILRNDYALVILDVQMPGMDGFEVAEAIAGNRRSSEIPILFLSAANKDKSFISKGYASGAVDYITKPVDSEILILKVKTFVRLHEQQKQLAEARNALRKANEELEKRVAERTDQLLASNDQLQQYASVVSHDLKEPLRKIQVYSSILQNRYEPEGDAFLNDYVYKIQLSSQRMYALINDLLSYSKLSGGSPFETVQFNELIGEILVDLELPIQQKDAQITIAALEPVEAIPSQMRQVFQNLLSNALKFSRPGVRPEIRIEGNRVGARDFDAQQSENGNFYHVRVSDNGIGFDNKYLDRIFTIFQRLHPQDQYEGTGIGLAIARKIIEKHHGIIRASGAQNEGATFEFILPTVQTAPAAQAG